MKLNKQQINALASKFHDELVTEYNKVNEIFKEKQLEKFKSNYEKGIKLLKNNTFLKSIEINIGDSNTTSLELNDSFENYTKQWSFNRIIKDIKKELPCKQTVINDIILATIDSTSVDEIMKNLKQKYK